MTLLYWLGDNPAAINPSASYIDLDILLTGKS